MLEMMRELWGKGYHFVETGYYGESDVEDFEQVEDSYEEAEEEEFLTFEVEIDHEAQTVTYWVEDDE